MCALAYAHLRDEVVRQCEIAQLQAATYLAGGAAPDTVDMPRVSDWLTRFEDYLDAPPLRVSDPDKWELLTALGMEVD